jgi:hypothetical protein
MLPRQLPSPTEGCPLQPVWLLHDDWGAIVGETRQRGSGRDGPLRAGRISPEATVAVRGSGYRYCSIVDTATSVPGFRIAKSVIASIRFPRGAEQWPIDRRTASW